MTTAEFVDYYELLGVAETAGDAQIRTAIKEQQRLWRSRQNSPDLHKRQTAERRMADCAEAEKILLNPESRRSFDTTRNENKKSRTAAMAEDGVDDHGMEASNYFEAAQWHQAMAHAARALEGSGSVASRVTRDRLCFIRGIAALNAGPVHTDTGIESLRQAIHLKPDVAEYYFELAMAYIELSTEDPGPMLDQTLALDPTNQRFLLARAAVHLDAHEPMLAMPILEKLLENVDRKAADTLGAADDAYANELMAHAIMDLGRAKLSRRRVLTWEDPDPEYWIASKEQAEELKRGMTQAVRHLEAAEKQAEGTNAVDQLRTEVEAARTCIRDAEDALKVRLRLRQMLRRRKNTYTKRELALQIVAILAVAAVLSGLGNITSPGGAVPAILIGLAVLYRIVWIPGYLQNARKFEAVVAGTDRNEVEFHRGVGHKPIRQFGEWR